MFAFGPTMVPISAKGGDSGGGGAVGAASGGGAATAGASGAGGRRDAENSGRSRVAARALSGTVQSGFPLCEAGFRAGHEHRAGPLCRIRHALFRDRRIGGLALGRLTIAIIERAG